MKKPAQCRRVGGLKRNFSKSLTSSSKPNLRVSGDILSVFEVKAPFSNMDEALVKPTTSKILKVQQIMLIISFNQRMENNRADLDWSGIGRCINARLHIWPKQTEVWRLTLALSEASIDISNIAWILFLLTVLITIWIVAGYLGNMHYFSNVTGNQIFFIFFSQNSNMLATITSLFSSERTKTEII